MLNGLNPYGQIEIAKSAQSRYGYFYQTGGQIGMDIKRTVKTRMLLLKVFFGLVLLMSISLTAGS